MIGELQSGTYEYSFLGATVHEGHNAPFALWITLNGLPVTLVQLARQIPQTLQKEGGLT